MGPADAKFNENKIKWSQHKCCYGVYYSHIQMELIISSKGEIVAYVPS